MAWFQPKVFCPKILDFSLGQLILIQKLRKLEWMNEWMNDNWHLKLMVFSIENIMVFSMRHSDELNMFQTIASDFCNALQYFSAIRRSIGIFSFMNYGRFYLLLLSDKVLMSFNFPCFSSLLQPMWSQYFPIYLLSLVLNL